MGRTVTAIVIILILAIGVLAGVIVDATPNGPAGSQCIPRIEYHDWMLDSESQC
jgi:hypothetical protein